MENPPPTERAAGLPVVDTWCAVCGEAVREDALQRCAICRTLLCRGCGVEGYGRFFCTRRCRDYFFFGDMEDADLEE